MLSKQVEGVCSVLVAAITARYLQPQDSTCCVLSYHHRSKLKFWGSGDINSFSKTGAHNNQLQITP